jgi:hypothetical protein
MESYWLVYHHFAMLTIFQPFFLEQLEQDFPFWKCLHGFWWMLPNFNPHMASSEPGQDLAADMLALIQGRGQENNDKEDDTFGTDGTQGGTNNNKGDDSTMQRNKEVCHQLHPLYNL